MNSIPQDDTPQKQCTGPCGRWLPATLDYFYKARKGLRTQCKACVSAAGKVNAAKHVEDRKARYQAHQKERLAQAAQYREAHREEVRASNRRYRETHQEKVQSIQKQYYQTHQEELRAAQRDYRETYREVISAKESAYYQAHREVYRAKNRHYYEENQEARKEQARQDRRKRPTVYRERDKAKHHKRRASKKNQPGTLTAQQIREKLRAQKYTCYYCFRTFEQRKDKTYVYHLDHVIPLSRTEHNPRHDVNNTVLACPHCNMSKSDKLPGEWIEGGRLF